MDQTSPVNSVRSTPPVEYNLENYDVKSVTKCQALIKGFLTRDRLKKTAALEARHAMEFKCGMIGLSFLILANIAVFYLASRGPDIKNPKIIPTNALNNI